MLDEPVIVSVDGSGAVTAAEDAVDIAPHSGQPGLERRVVDVAREQAVELVRPLHRSQAVGEHRGRAGRPTTDRVDRRDACGEVATGAGRERDDVGGARRVDVAREA